jgi:putative endonuclease
MVGKRGERAAARHLRKEGFRILERNFRVTYGELDLVGFRRGLLAFVEVRTQTEPALIDPLLTVTPAKQKRVVRAAERYCTARALRSDNVTLRFDIVTVLLDARGRVTSLRHFEDAFRAGRRPH